MHDELTQGDIDKMEKEIGYRSTVKRNELLQALKEARAQGDLSENFEYSMAKRENNRNNSRIRYLKNMIKTAKIVSDHSAADEVGLDNTVTVYYPDDDQEETFRIVTTIRGDSLNGLISKESPLGRAVLGSKVGEKVHVTVNEQVGYDVKILRIDKSSDDSQDEIASY